MRFISQYPGYTFQARPQRMRALGDGGIEVTQPPLYLKFSAVHEGATVYENEIAAALKHFQFRGNTQLQDEATPSDPILRLSVFDTDEYAREEGLSEEDRQLVERRLVELAVNSPEECLMVAETPIAAPFPAYDNWQGTDPEMLMVKLIEDGFDLPLVLHYERTFGPRRPAIISALEETIEAQEANVVRA